MKTAYSCLLVLAVLAGVNTSAVAQPVTAETGFSVERFRLSTTRQGILDVESAEVPKHLSFDVGLWLGYADQPLNVYETVDGDRERRGSLVKNRLAGSLVGAFGLFDALQIGVALPVILNQNQSSGINGTPPSLDGAGIGDLRLIPKIQILNSRDHGVDFALSVGFTFPTSSSDDYFGGARTNFEPELLVSKPITDDLRVGVNLGYRNRKEQQIINLIVRDEWFTHLGAAYMITEKLEVDATFSAATSVNNIFGRFNENHAEVKGGLAYYLGPVVLFAAGGIGIGEGFGTPDWRALGGVRFGWLRGEEEPVVEEDTDGDGLLDSVDSCPLEPENLNGFEDDDGCPDEIADTDGDGILDNMDKCVDQPEDVDTFEDEDGCPDPDNDGDGVTDTADKCPLEPGVVQAEGCPEKDTDGDGVPDHLDNCPKEPGDAENSGCKVKQVVKLVDGKLELLDRVFFRTNRARIRSISYPLLKNVAQVLNNHPEIQTIQVQGHTDARGKDSANKSLSQRRADSVVTFLVKEGVAKERLEAVGYGEEQPVDTNDTEAGRAANRRVEFKIIGDSAGIESQESGPSTDTIGK